MILPEKYPHFLELTLAKCGLVQSKIPQYGSNVSDGQSGLRESESGGEVCVTAHFLHSYLQRHHL